MLILNKKNKFICNMKKADENALKYNESSKQSQKILMGLKLNDNWVKCNCGVSMCVVSNDNIYFFRRIQSETKRHEQSCEFWKSDIPKDAFMTKKNIPKEAPGFILNMSPGVNSKEKTSKENDETEGHSRANSIKYKTIFSLLYNIVESLGINVLPYNVTGKYIRWSDISQHIKSTIYTDFFWCPGIAKGLVGLNQRLLNDWQHPGIAPEGLIVGIVDDIPKGKLEIKKQSTSTMTIKGGKIKTQSISVIGKTGPYLMMAVCTPNNSDSVKFTTPNIHRLVFQSIVSWGSLVPVDSQLERNVAKYFIQRGIPFIKPLYAEGNNLLPDFIIPNKCIIEVQGMVDEDYIIRKEEIHHSMENYYNLPVLTYDANIGESFNTFQNKLIRFLRY